MLYKSKKSNRVFVVVAKLAFVVTTTADSPIM